MKVPPMTRDTTKCYSSTYTGSGCYSPTCMSRVSTNDLDNSRSSTKSRRKLRVKGLEILAFTALRQRISGLNKSRQEADSCRRNSLADGVPLITVTPPENNAPRARHRERRADSKTDPQRLHPDSARYSARKARGRARSRIAAKEDETCGLVDEGSIPQLRLN